MNGERWKRQILLPKINVLSFIANIIPLKYINRQFLRFKHLPL